MSDYIPVELQRQVKNHFANRCAYCQSSEDLTVAIFEIEHIIPRSAGGKQLLIICVWLAQPAIVTKVTGKLPQIRLRMSR